MKRKTSIITLGALLLVFALSSIKAVGSIPTSYNQSAQDILKMLWGKLDAAYTANYQARMLVRYHDHEGTNPGDFTSRGLPIATNGIEDEAITTDKVSDTLRTRTESVSTGTLLAAEENTGIPIFVASHNATVTKVSFGCNNESDQSDTDFITMHAWLSRPGVMVGTIATVTTQATGGQDFHPTWQPVVRQLPNLNLTSIEPGDVIFFSNEQDGSGETCVEGLVTIEYVIDE